MSSEWWHAITNQSPEVENALPRQQTVSISGAYRGAHMTLFSGADRIDIVLQPMPAPPGQLPDPVAGEAIDLLRALSDAIRPVKDRIAVSRRLALAGTLFRPSQSNEHTYLLLKETLKSVLVVPGKMSDLNYRVNWPVEVDGRRFNRLTTWSSVLARTYSVTTAGAQVGTEDRFFMGCEFDINTVPVLGLEFSSEQTEIVFDQMAELILQNMAQGEVTSP